MAGLLEGKSVLVTGGVRGIGLAVANKFYEDDARVFIFDKNAPSQSLVARTKVHTVNVRNKANVKKHLAQVFSLANGLDILINNAGVDLAYLHNSPEKDRQDVWDEVLGTNLDAIQYLTSLVVKYWLERHNKGVIVFVTSVHTALAFPGGGAYDAAKLALVGYMRSIALEHGPDGIRSNAVAPGFIYPTGITYKLSEKQVQDFAGRIPSRRPGTSEDVAKVVAFLASDEASYINGAEIRVDGGLAIQNHLF